MAGKSENGCRDRGGRVILDPRGVTIVVDDITRCTSTVAARLSPPRTSEASCIGADRDVPAETAVVAGHRAIIFTEINGGRQIESWYARDASCGPHARRAVRRGTCQFGLLSQGFALAGTCVGLVTIAIGIGPRSLVDLMLHVTMIVLLVGGLRVAAHADPARHA